MMGAGGFIRNPGWEIVSGDDLMDEDFDNGVTIEDFFADDTNLDGGPQLLLYLHGGDNESADELFDEYSSPSESDDDDSLDDEDFDDDNAITMSSDDSAPEFT